MNPIDLQAKIAACIAAVALVLIFMTVHGRAAWFYPACLKKDGDWLHGATSHECRQLGGHWYTARKLKKARKVW